MAKRIFTPRAITSKYALPVLQTHNWDVPPLPALRDFIHMYRLKAKKVLSQNYIMNMQLNRKVVHKAGDINDGMVIEIGPGPGGITRALLERPVRRLDVIEIDERFIPPLDILKGSSNGRLHIHSANILKTDEEQIWKDAGAERLSWLDEKLPPLHLIGNLPFNIAIPLILRREGAWTFGRVPLTLTFQLEVAKRIVSKIDSDFRSRLSIMAQFVSVPKLVFEMPGIPLYFFGFQVLFCAKTKVDVGLVRFVPRITPLINAPYEVVEKVVRHVFMFRQRHLSHGLKALYPRELVKELYPDIIKHSCIDPKRISVELEVEEVGQLCDVYYMQCNENPGLFLYRKENWKKGMDVLKDLPTLCHLHMYSILRTRSAQKVSH
uniref:rRNA adenine N(6)-methyltransferase n=1 Tax=Ditylenchus dipsaci TaxID=166011 RepID=A0A915EDA2_9BILA